MKKILFVSANNYKVPYPVYPIGISYLYTYLVKNLPDFEFTLFDFNLNSFDDFEHLLKENSYSYIEVSLRNVDDTNIYAKNTFIFHYKNIFSYLRKYSKSILIVGGSGFSIFPKLIFGELLPDFGIKGEGEESNLKLIYALENNLKLTDIEGLVYCDSFGNIIVNERDKYLHRLELQFDNSLVDYYWDKSGMLNIQTKRGCPNKCIYCSYPVIEGRVVRTLEPNIVVNNIMALKKTKKVNYFFFTDSIFNINKKYNAELCNLLIDNNVNVSWGAYFSPNNLTYDDLVLYKKAGLTHIEFGTDSFSDVQLNNYCKGFSFADVELTSCYCYDLGIFYAHFLILGGYGETEETLDETFENCKKIEHSVFFPYVGMRIYPSTKLCEIALQEGVIHDVSELINPIYYVSDKIDINNLQKKAELTGKKWFFPDDQISPMMSKLRQKRIRGPLWEYLRY